MAAAMTLPAGTTAAPGMITAVRAEITAVLTAEIQAAMAATTAEETAQVLETVMFPAEIQAAGMPTIKGAWVHRYFPGDSGRPDTG